MVKMSTISFEYQTVVLYSSQLSSTSHMSLQLPYIIFGLGTTPNFVESLTISILAMTSSEIVGRKKDWHQIIPNSQLVINPAPRDHPY
jgi:integrin alpha FG-GAP repeat containing protein 1